jgi:cytochrome c2
MTPRLAMAAAALSLLAVAPARADSHGEQVYREVCRACHKESVTPEEARTQNLAGPPMNFMTTHMRQKANHDKQVFVEHVVEYTMNPSRETSWAMPRAIERFGLMPSLKVIAPKLERSDVRAVAQWMWQRYDYEAQRDLLRDHHGPGGMGPGQGHGQGGGRVPGGAAN